ncbi:hypothetical protein [Streptomyces sp. AcE210]|uniref:hypothetical protein n=1 Tax=Streptomyces sp. AcE210 TaxID=2292703 RepID=UPI001F0CB4C8|nr:hypothetical protein [Streptomyces sp. AcE210]
MDFLSAGGVLGVDVGAGEQGGEGLPVGHVALALPLAALTAGTLRLVVQLALPLRPLVRNALEQATGNFFAAYYAGILAPVIVGTLVTAAMTLPLTSTAFAVLHNRLLSRRTSDVPGTPIPFPTSQARPEPGSGASPSGENSGAGTGSARPGPLVAEPRDLATPAALGAPGLVRRVE